MHLDVLLKSEGLTGISEPAKTQNNLHSHTRLTVRTHLQVFAHDDTRKQNTRLRPELPRWANHKTAVFALGQ
jgi:hypothetical protein